jgi:phage-related baseplate assembly protein
LSSNIDKLKNLTDIDFVDTDVETLLADLIDDYETEYKNETGEAKTLSQGDPVRILLYANAARIYAILQSINNSAKQNLLKYAEGDYLDQLAARVEVTREAARAATATVYFKLSATQSGAVPVPLGTRVAAGDVYFKTMEYNEIPAEQEGISIVVTCTETGSVGNGYTPGQINTLVDPIQYVTSVSNTDTSAGGADEEDDDSLRERVYLRPESFSVAGPSGAYEYFAKEYSSEIGDVKILQSETTDGEVDIYIIKEDGTTPDELVSGLQTYLSADNLRPLTDKVVVQPPEQVGYDLDLTYYINSSDSDTAENIQNAVNDAIHKYEAWQCSKIGRDINPDYLRYLVCAAGAKRVVINSPDFTVLSDSQVASLGKATITYGGTEDE